MSSIAITHHGLVEELKKPGQDILDSLTPEKVCLWHMATGLIGEVFELEEALHKDDRENIVEELGDFRFYLRGIWNNDIIHTYGGDEVVLKSTFDMIAPNFGDRSQHIMQTVKEKSSELHDLVKKTCIYNKPNLSKQLRDLTLDLATNHLAMMIYLFRTTPQEVEHYNIQKLKLGKKARYKDGYTDQAAQERADKEGEQD